MKALAEDARLRALGALAAGVVHELSSPLSYVNANLRHVVEELARALPRQPELAEALSDALDGASQVAELVGDLRVYAYASGDEPAQVDVRATLERVVRLVRPMLHGRARLFREYQGTPLAWVNEARLAQLFVMFVHDASADVSLTCRTADGKVVIEVDCAGELPDIMACRALAVCCGGDLAIDTSGPRPFLRACVPLAG